MSASGERTFEHQSELPPLPVPDLDLALDKYLDSAEVLVSSQEFERTKAIVEEFRKGEAKILHEALLERAEKYRNWIEQWWEEKAYLEDRSPIFPCVNFAGPSPDLKLIPPLLGTQLEMAALHIYLTMKYWQLIRLEQLAVMKSRGIPWCMHQTTCLFNNCRVPGQFRDTIERHFKLSSEGDCPTHVVVLCRGHLWRLETCDSEDSNNLYTPSQLLDALHLIRSSSAKSAPFINVLTTSDRSTWFRNRQHLISLSPTNLEHLRCVQSSAFIFVLTDEVLNTENDLTNFSMIGDPRCQWPDKCLTYHMHLNGLSGMSCDHSAMDAIVLTQLTQWTNGQLRKLGTVWKEKFPGKNCPEPVELKFLVDEKILKAIREAEESCRAICDDVYIRVFHFTEFGNDLFRKLKLYGDTVVQEAIQLAYYKLHRKPVSTYETASARQFYHGRTETVRSCTKESVEWCKIMLDDDASLSEKLKLFKIAMNKQNELMTDAINGQGCDRLMLGLETVAQQLGRPKPTIFLDSTWVKTGGYGNFHMSTSFLGYGIAYGGVVAMSKDGYGTFYKMEKNRMTFFLTGWKSSSVTNVDLFYDHLIDSLRIVHGLLVQMAAKSKV